MSSTMGLAKKRESSSNVDLSHVSRGTMMPGVVYPVSFVDVVPGDSFVVEPSVFIQSLPLIAPLMGSFDICLEMFFAGDRLYNYKMFNNLTGAMLDPSKIIFECVTPSYIPSVPATGTVPLNSRTDLTVAPNSLAEFMGFPVGFGPYFDKSIGYKRFNLNRALVYIDVIRNYYANQQETHIPTGLVSTDASSPGSASIQGVELSMLDQIVSASRSDQFSTDDFMDWADICPSYRMLFCRTMAPERLETWLNTSNYDLNSGKVSVSVTDNEVVLTDARFGSHVLRYLELAMSGGSRYSDFVDAQFDVNVGRDTTTPVFLGSCRSSLAFDKVLQTSESSQDSPLGNLAGQGSSGEKFRRRRFSFNEHGTFMVCLSLRPRVDYSRGIDPMLLKTNLESKFAPALDRIGFQPLLQAEVDALPLGVSGEDRSIPSVHVFGATDPDTGQPDPRFPDPFTNSVGYQPAWSEYMSVANRLHGKLTADMRYWALDRLYSTSFVRWLRADLPSGFESYWQWMQHVYSTDRKISSYVRPDLYNFAFADNSVGAENFIYQVALNIKARRRKSKINIPNFI